MQRCRCLTQKLLAPILEPSLARPLPLLCIKRCLSIPPHTHSHSQDNLLPWPPRHGLLLAGCTTAGLTAVQSQCVRYAGHSKWSNIKHIKAAKDDQRRKVTNAVLMKVKLAALEGGSFDPKINTLLAKTIQHAKEQDVSLSSVETTLKKLSQSKSAGTKMSFDIMSFGNSLLIITCMTSSASRMRQDIRSVCNKFGGKMIDKAISTHSFNYKGVVYLPPSSEMSLDDALELAIEVGAEEVEETEDEEGNRQIMFICEDREVHQVSKELKAHDIAIAEVTHSYLPFNYVTLSEEQATLTSKFIQKILEHEDVIKVFDNIKVE